MESKGEVSYANLSVTSSTGLAASTRTACFMSEVWVRGLNQVPSGIVVQKVDVKHYYQHLSEDMWKHMSTPMFYIIRLDKKNNLTF